MAKRESRPKEETRTVVLAAPAGLTELARFNQRGADALMITADNHDSLGETRRWVIGRLKHWRALFKELRQPIVDAMQAHKNIEADKLAAADYYVTISGSKLDTWEREEDRLAAERQRIADEAEERKAREQRQAEADELRRIAELARTKREQKRIERQADRVKDAPLPMAAAAPVEKTYSRIKGTKRTEHWNGAVTSEQLVFAHLAAGRLPASLVTFKPIELNNLAKTHKEKLASVFPGLSASSKKGMAG